MRHENRCAVICSGHKLPNEGKDWGMAYPPGEIALSESCLLPKGSFRAFLEVDMQRKLQTSPGLTRIPCCSVRFFAHQKLATAGVLWRSA